MYTKLLLKIDKYLKVEKFRMFANFLNMYNDKVYLLYNTFKNIFYT